MKFEIKHNVLKTGVKKVNLNDKEADYIIALSTGIKKDEIIKALLLEESEIEELYKKFKLNNKDLNRDMQLITLCLSGNFLGEYFELNSERKFIFPECQELSNTIAEIQNAEKEFKKEIENAVEEMIEERFSKEKER